MTAVVSSNALYGDALHGDLREFPLNALLGTLESSRRTGVLQIEDGSDIWFSYGRIYLVTSPSSAPVEAVLYGAGAGPADEIRSRLKPNVTRSALQHILAHKPEMEPTLRILLHEYILNGLFELLVPSRLRFNFDPGRYHPLGDELAEDTTELLGQAQSRLDVWRRIAARIPSTSARFVMARRLPNGARDRVIDADDWLLLALLDGRRSVEDLVTTTGRTPFQVCSTLYRLLLEGLVEEPTEPTAKSAG